MSSYFLLGKRPDERLVLLSSAPLASRRDALAELSRLTADPGFEHWDAEVFVLDLDTGTPVLLVRPEVPASPAPESEGGEPAAQTVGSEETEEAEKPVVASMGALDLELEQLDEPVLLTEAEPEADVDEALAAVIEDLEGEVLDDAAALGDAADAEAPEDVAAIGAREDAAAIEAPEPVFVEPPHITPVVEPLPEAAQVDAAYAEAVMEAAAEEPSALKAALERTAAQMEASGITPPESVGPEPESMDVQPEPIAPEAAWPWAKSEDEADASPAFTIPALEEPGVDEGSLVRAAGDDETMAAARPVILGAYGESPAPAVEAPISEQEAVEAETAVAMEVTREVSAAASAAEAAGMESEAPVADAGEHADASQPADAEAESDFILDLEQLTSDQTIPAGYQPPDAVPEMTCDDCVYVETCPNKEERDPSSCGSFQWR